MKILHVTNHLSRTGGGTPAVVWALARAQSDAGEMVTVSGLADRYDSEDFPPNPGERVSVQTYTQGRPWRLGWSRQLHNTWLKAAESDVPDIFHQHGIWSLLSYSVAMWRRRWRRPTVISPHGMLDPWALGQGRVRKALFRAVVEQRNLDACDCVHVLCESEAAACRSFGISTPIAVIPGAVRAGDYADLPAADPLVAKYPRLGSSKIMLFLGRLHPKKGLRELLEAWSATRDSMKDWRLLVAGRDQLDHRRELEEVCRSRALDDRVVFAGPLHGEAKLQALALADANVLPSHSEGFPVSTLEAAAAGLPSLITAACNFPELAVCGGAIEVRDDSESIATGLRRICRASDAEREAMGRTARDLVRREYTWARRCEQTLELYRWLLDGGAPPRTVQGAS